MRATALFWCFWMVALQSPLTRSAAGLQLGLASSLWNGIVGLYR